MNSREPALEKSRPSPVSTSVVMMLIIIIGTLVLLAVFANVQRFRHNQVETVVVRPATTTAPQTR